MRYIKPKSNKFHKLSESIMESGDGAWYPVLGGIGATIATVTASAGLVFDSEPLFALVYIPAAAFFSTVLGYMRGTTYISSSDASWYRQAKYNVMPKVEGTFVEEYAQPLLQQIWEHTLEGHPQQGYNACELCGERLNVMRELVPNKPTNMSDVEQAKLFIEERKRFEIER